jgi:hypothetical protein
VLNLDVIDRDGGHVLRGRFSPQPNVWTLFMAIYGVLALVGLGGLMFGLAKLTVDESPAASGISKVGRMRGGRVMGVADGSRQRIGSVGCLPR